MPSSKTDVPKWCTLGGCTSS